MHRRRAVQAKSPFVRIAFILPLVFICVTFVAAGPGVRFSSTNEFDQIKTDTSKNDVRLIVMFRTFGWQENHHVFLKKYLHESWNMSEGNEWTFIQRRNPAMSHETDFALIELHEKNFSAQTVIESMQKQSEIRCVSVDQPVQTRKPLDNNKHNDFGHDSSSDVEIEDQNDWMTSNTQFYLGSHWQNQTTLQEGRRSTSFSIGLGHPDRSEVVNRRQVLGVIPRFERHIQPAEEYQASKLWDIGISGKGVRVAIFDTGMNSFHPNFKNVLERTDWTDDNVNEDTVGHGTFVAGVIAGSEDCLGFAPDATLYIFRVFNSRQVSYTSWFLDAFNHALSLKIDVLNLSIGGPDYMDIPFVEKVRDLTASGIVVVSAIGNDGPLYGTLNNPADQPDVIGVGAINTEEELAYFSSRGMTTWELPEGYGRAKPDVVAHGQNVLGLSLSGKCKTLSGTSVASPVVAGAITLLISAAKAINLAVNPAVIKQVLAKSSKRIESANLFEQGSGHFDLIKAYEHLMAYSPQASVVPSKIDFTDCEYMWPYCSQELYFSALPVIVNATISCGLDNFCVVDKAIEWIPQSNGNHLKIETEVVELKSPWAISLAVFIGVYESAMGWSGISEGSLRLSVSSISRTSAKRVSSVDLPIKIRIIPTPSRSKRILWDQFHNIKYPPAFFPRDTLRLKNDPLDWRGDHIHTNFRSAYQFMRKEGYYVEVLGGPYTCFDAKLYGTLLIVDPEDNFGDFEIDKLEKDIRLYGLSIVVFAEWFNTEVMKKIVFFDENTRRWWTPVVGGANIPSLNKLLKRFDMEFGTAVLTGDIGISSYKVPFDSGSPIIRFPRGGVLVKTSLLDEGEHIIHKTNPVFSDAGVIGLYSPNMTHPLDSIEGRISLFGDSSCIDSVDPRDDCFWMLKSFLRWSSRGILDAPFRSAQYRLQVEYLHPQLDRYSFTSDFDVGNTSNHHFVGRTCPKGSTSPGLEFKDSINSLYERDLLSIRSEAEEELLIIKGNPYSIVQYQGTIIRIISIVVCVILFKMMLNRRKVPKSPISIV